VAYLRYFLNINNFFYPRFDLFLNHRYKSVLKNLNSIFGTEKSMLMI